MSDEPHVDLASYVLGGLEPDEHAAFEQHLTGCVQCREELGDFAQVAGLLTAAGDPYDVPTDLREKTRAAVARATEGNPQRRFWRRFTVVRGGTFALAGAAVAMLAFFVGQRYEARDRGPLEVSATLSAPTDGSIQGRVRVVKTGIGRVIEFRTDELPILPKGEFYELWFVGAGDTLEQPNRISAGTFHPDEKGRSHVTFAAAVDPAKFPILSVTAEPGDGDPRRTGAEVLRSEPS